MKTVADAPSKAKCSTTPFTNIKVCLPVPTEAERIVFLPAGTLWCMVVPTALAQSTVLLADTRESTSLPALVHWVNDPVNSRIAADRFMAGVDENNLVVFINTILVHPVRVQHPQVATTTPYALLRSASQATLVFEVIDTLTHGLAVGSTLRHWLLPVTPAYPDAIDDITLLSLIAKATSLVGARGARGTVDDVQLTVLPAPNAEQEAKDIRLLFLV